MLEELWCREVKIDEQVLDMPPSFEMVSFYLFTSIQLRNTASDIFHFLLSYWVMAMESGNTVYLCLFPLSINDFSFLDTRCKCPNRWNREIILDQTLSNTNTHQLAQPGFVLFLFSPNTQQSVLPLFCVSNMIS